MEADQLILWQDAEVLAVNKPAGLPTLPDGYNPNAPHLRGILTPIYGPLWIVHRLDRDTSGVILLARSAAAHRSLNTQFEHHTIRKTYHALCLGHPGWQEKTVRMPLRVNVGHKHRTTVDFHNGKPAITHFKVIQHFSACTLLEARPETGRTHQIRAHLYALGLPLAADELYGGGECLEISPGAAIMTRMALHAQHLTFTHPATAQSMDLTAGYPIDFTNALAALEQTSPYAHEQV